MSNKRVQWGFYDNNVGDYDEYNPRYVYRKEQVPEISYLIASNPPWSLSENNIAEILKIDCTTCTSALEAMLKINAISIREGRYKINFPVFLEKDVEILREFSEKTGKILGNRIISLIEEIDLRLKRLSHFDENKIERLRYHVIGCDTLDGGVMKRFAGEELLTVSKPQPGGRDYIIIGYEENESVYEFSDRLLCSCNIYYSDNIGFASFGDANGSRKDMMRFFRRLQSGIENITEHRILNLSYINLLDNYNKVIAKECSSLLLRIIKETLNYSELNEKERKDAEFLRELGYLDYESKGGIIQCIVPVFEPEDMKVINEISDLIADDILETVKQTIADLDKEIPGLTSIMHGVDFRDIANELWHLMFGPTNEYLVKSGFFSEPIYKKGEGRYFQGLYIYK